jgi:hypothetical protein
MLLLYSFITFLFGMSASLVTSGALTSLDDIASRTVETEGPIPAWPKYVRGSGGYAVRSEGSVQRAETNGERMRRYVRRSIWVGHYKMI